MTSSSSINFKFEANLDPSKLKSLMVGFLIGSFSHYDKPGLGLATMQEVVARGS